MSNFNGQHAVVSYVSGVTKALSGGNRLAVISYKTVKDKLTGKDLGKKESKAVSVPLLDDVGIKGQIPELIPHIRDMLAGVQDKIIREMLDSEVSCSHISDADISISACISYLESESGVGRMTKVMLNEWFDTCLADDLMVALANKLGVSDVPSAGEAAKIEGLMSVYREKLSALAGGKTSYDVKTAVSLIKALELKGNIADDSIGGKLHEKLVKMRDKEIVPMVDLL